jgi:hypothetical protein
VSLPLLRVTGNSWLRICRLTSFTWPCRRAVCTSARLSSSAALIGENPRLFEFDFDNLLAKAESPSPD